MSVNWRRYYYIEDNFKFNVIKSHARKKFLFKPDIFVWKCVYINRHRKFYRIYAVEFISD
jgi:hypothetical protein